MSLELIKFAFVAGELSPTFFGRPDLEKFDLGLALARNWFVDYRGGLTTRPGQAFVDWIKDDDKPVKMFEFKYAPNVANTYVLLFGEYYVRFIQDGAYVLETGKNITGITKANPGVVTSAVHGFNNGDWVKLAGIAGMTELNGRTAKVANKAANTFELQDVFGNNINTSTFTTYTSGGTASRVYTLTTPYAASDLAGLSSFQYRDLVRLTHLDFAPRELVRTAATNWTLTETAFGSAIAAPTGLTGTFTAATTDGADIAFAVTAVNADGDESLASDIYLPGGTALNYSAAAGAANLEWTAVADTQYYKVFRSTITRGSGTTITRGAQLGYIGKAYGTEFLDNNILPDFTETPPLHVNPFANSAITFIEVTAPGTGYNRDSELTVTDADGTGFSGYAVISGSGEVLSVVITNGGEGYTNPSVSLADGADATFDVTLGEATGNNPALSTIFQQRQLYAATTNAPFTIWGSKPKRYDNFDVSTIIQENDSYEFELDTTEVTPIRHLVSKRGGLLILTDAGVWQLTGGSATAAVTPTNALAEPHTYIGCSSVPPISIDTDLLYIESKGFTVRQLEYNDFSRLYSGIDVSILSNHFFTESKYIINWAHAADPFKLVWSVRSDGAMLSFTIVKEQNVFAWTQHWTRGYYREVIAIRSDRTDAVYMVVERYINGRWTKFVEKQATRSITHVEDYFGVDCGLTLVPTYPAADLQPSAVSGTVTFEASTAVFSAGDVGKVLRVGGGKAVITTYTDTTHVIGTVVRDITDILPESDDVPALTLSGTWTLDANVTAVSGLWHLEGETVRVLADGNVLPDKTVTNGAIALGVSASRVTVGLGFNCYARTLPLTSPQVLVEGKRKRIMGAVPRLNESRGLKAGMSLSRLYAMKERTTEAYGEPTELISGAARTVMFEPKWEAEGQVYFAQEEPLPASLLGIVLSTEIGDDPG